MKKALQELQGFSLFTTLFYLVNYITLYVFIAR